MSLKRKFILPALLSLSTAGSIAAGTTAIVLTSSAPAAVAASAHAAKPDFIYFG